MRAARPYSDPYVAGTGLGLVLLAAFILTGRGLGASGAFATVAAHAIDGPHFARYLDGDYWLFFELIGVIAGGFVSALLAGRIKAEIERGPRVSSRSRVLLAVAGGGVMGLGAVLARGCTSGLALTGGSLLAVGSWVFMIAAFAAAYLFAPILKKEWL